jgi:hypothetical protein
MRWYKIFTITAVYRESESLNSPYYSGTLFYFKSGNTQGLGLLHLSEKGYMQDYPLLLF